MTKVGIARALYYYEFGEELTHFISQVGLKPVLSYPSDAKVLPHSIRAPADGACMPVKAYITHCAQLLEDGADVLLLPRAVKCSRCGFTCPKVIGIPEMVKQALKPEIPIISTPMNGRLIPFLTRTGVKLGCSPAASYRAAAHCSEEKARKSPTVTEAPSHPRVLLLGRKYLTDDESLNLGIRKKLKNLGYNCVSASEYRNTSLISCASQQSGRIPFWISGEQSAGLASMLSSSTLKADGVIYLSAFGCGPDSYLRQYIKTALTQKADVPFLDLTLDTHTAHAGLDTRLEAFADMLERRNRK